MVVDRQLRTWSHRPWNPDGVQLLPVHHARVGVEVKFRDFTELSPWVGEHVANTDGFRVSRVQSALTVKRRDELMRQVSTKAVLDACNRAQQYADALGLGKIHPVAVADAGMLGESLHPRPVSDAYLGVGSASSAGDADVELVPEHIEVSAAVDARFAVEDA